MDKNCPIPIIYSISDVFSFKLRKGYGCIYCYVDENGKKNYIGQTIKNIKKRHHSHMNYDSNCPFDYYLRKHNHNLYIIYTCERPELTYYENFFIEKYDTFSPNGWNFKKGEDSVIFSEETLKKLSLASSGKNNPMYGVRLCGEKNGMYGVRLCGEKNGMYGKTHSPETRRKLSESHKCVFIEWEGKTYGFKELCAMHGLSHQCVRYRLNHGWDLERAFTTKPNVKPK